VRRLVLVRHATTSAVRRAAFPADEPLDASGLAAARVLRGTLRGDAFAGPSIRARSTASELGLEPVIADALDECDFGSWAGRALSDCSAAEMADWLAGGAPHGGESLSAFRARVGAWLAAQADLDGRAVAVTSGGVIKAAVVHALGAPDDAFWRVDAAPLHTTELHAHDGRWTVAHVNAPLAPSRAASPAAALQRGSAAASPAAPEGGGS
jgi:broad specificity phosphatase PhoE